MFHVTRRFEFDSAHRLLGYGGPCRFLHGHHYAVEVTVSGDQLDGLGMLVDFGELKGVVWGWLKANWDHAALLSEDDPLLAQTEGAYSMGNRNPTAEVMAEMSFNGFKTMLSSRVKLVRVRLYETPNCWVDYNE